MSNKFLFINNKTTKLYKSRYPKMEASNDENRLYVLLALPRKSNVDQQLFTKREDNNDSKR